MSVITIALGARAGIISKAVDYKQGDAVLEGFSVYDDALQGKRPGVLVAHQWRGLGDYEKKRAEMLAKLGYNVFAVDILRKRHPPTDSQRRRSRGREVQE